MLSTRVLHGRADLLDRAGGLLDLAAAGTGRLLLLTGEAGIGKTRVLRTLVDDATGRGFSTWQAGAFPRDGEVPAGLMLDLGHAMARSKRPDIAERCRALIRDLTEVSDPAPGSGDAHRRRRLLVLDVADRLAALADGGPALLALEDLHWCDELSLEIVAHLARRLPDLPLLVVGTVRTDELHQGAPVRAWRSQLLLQRMAVELPLPRLDLADTERMVAELLPGEPPSPQVLELVHSRSGGVPLHVEELVSAADRGRLDATHVPDTLAEAVRHRFAALSPPAQEVGVAAAVIRRSFDLDVLTAVAGCDDEHAARCLDELVDRHVVHEESPGWYGFRHALIRDAVELGAPLAARRSLHAAVADVARRRLDLGGDAYRSAHHEVAGQLEEASAAAAAAADRASALSAHQEALDLLHRAVRCLPPGDPERLATLLARRGAEAAATDHNEQAARDYERARAILLEHGDRHRAATVLPGLVAVRHLLGDDLATRIALLDEGIRDLGDLPDPSSDSSSDSSSGPDGDLRQAAAADLLAAKAAAYLVDDRLDEAIAAGERAVAVAGGRQEERTGLDTAITLGSVLAFAGRVDEGFRQMERATRRARELGLEAEAARGYRMITSSASTLVEYERAEAWLAHGIDYAERTEHWNHRHYMTAHQAHVRWCQGRWDLADRAVRQVLADGRGGVTTRIVAQHTAGFLALGRGDVDEAVRVLTEARTAGEEMRELQRYSPAVWGLAECALLRGDAAAAVALTEAGYEASSEVADAANLFPFLVTGVRARLALRDPVAAQDFLDRVAACLRRRGIPGTLPALDHAAGLLHLAGGRTGRARGRLVAARAGWAGRDRWWEGQWCALDLARCAVAANRRTEASGLVAEVTAAATAVGSRPLLAATAEIGSRLDQHDAAPAWAPLTLREYQVARLVARGLTNREIAEDLRISVRTAGAHLEHISAKLGASGRSAIAAWATALEHSSEAEASSR